MIELEPLRNFNVRAKVVGPGVSYLTGETVRLGTDFEVLAGALGIVRQVHPTGNTNSCSDQRTGIGFR